MAHVEENTRIAAEALENSLSKQDLGLVEEVRASYQKLLKVGCTGCRYCMPCPAKVNIPLSFELYNRVKSFGESRFNNYAHYAIHMGGFEGKREFASQCRDCKICIEKCPQKINIPEELKNVSKTFETLFFKFFCFFGKGFMTSISKR